MVFFIGITMVDPFNPREFDITRETPAFDIGAQRAEGQRFLGEFGEKLAGQETLSAAADRFAGELQIPQLREEQLRLGEESGDITSQLFGLPGQIAGTTRESLVTEAQRQGLVQAAATPLQRNLAQISAAGERVGARLSSAEMQLGQRLGLQQAELDRELLPFELGFTLLQQQQAREFSGYTFREQSELDRLVANQATGAGLSEGERNRLNELAIKEVEFRNALDQIKAGGEQARLTKKAPQDLGSLFGSIFG